LYIGSALRLPPPAGSGAGFGAEGVKGGSIAHAGES
jgi:hypothetical protein